MLESTSFETLIDFLVSSPSGSKVMIYDQQSNCFAKKGSFFVWKRTGLTIWNSEILQKWLWLESRVILWKTRFESSYHFSQRHSSRIRVTKNLDSSHWLKSRYHCYWLEMSTTQRQRSARCGFGKFYCVPAASYDFTNFKLRQRRIPRVRSSNDESWAKQRDFSGVVVLDHHSCFSCLDYSFYLRFSDASGRRFVGRILLLFFLQVACCRHCSDALACELLIQNCR